MSEEVENGNKWLQTGQFATRVKGEILETLREISQKHGNCGPKVILTILVQSYRDLKSIQAQA